MSSPADSPASRSPSPDEDWSKRILDGYGLKSSDAFAWFDPDSSCWRTSQGSFESLLAEDPALLESSLIVWPRSVICFSGLAFALPTWAHPTAETAGSASPSELLPSPSAQESTPTDEFVGEVRENLEDPHKRLYLPGRKWHAQRTLSRIVPALLPTPVTSDGRGNTDGEARAGGASLRELDRLLPTPNAWLGRRPENSMADPERAKSRENEGERGKRSIELPDAIAAEVKMLPTPTSRDHKGPNPNEREGGEDLPTAAGKLLPTPTAQEANPGAGGELRAAIQHGPERRSQSDTDTMGRPIRKGREPLLPTPQAADADGGRQEMGAAARGWKRPSGAKAAKPLGTVVRLVEEGQEEKLLPTPNASDPDRGPRSAEGLAKRAARKDKQESLLDAVQLLPTPRAVTSRSSRRAMVENQQWSAPSLEQAVEIAEGRLPREFETWDEVPGWSGESTSPRSDDGSASSDEPLPGQLTIGDDCPPSS